jgi:hypothetical protein
MIGNASEREINDVITTGREYLETPFYFRSKKICFSYLDGGHNLLYGNKNIC